MTIHLDDLRIRLDQMTERIVSRIKDRSRFPLNSAVYEAGAVNIEDREDLSFLRFSLEGLEAYHASLGRFDYPDQHPVYTQSPRTSPVARTIGTDPLRELEISIGEDLITFYTSVLPLLCRGGADPNSYGETVYLDADLLQLLNERINIGRYVAQVKLDRDPSILELAHQDAELAAKLRDASREEELLASVRAVAGRYGVDVTLAQKVFRWVIDETIFVEVAYLRGLQGDPA